MCLNLARLLLRPSLCIGRTPFSLRPAVLTAAGLVPFVRYLTLLHQHGNGRHWQSLILGTVLLTAALLALRWGGCWAYPY